ncbi:MAG: hypothetical protein JNJ94_15965 [Chlorobi bacterium]|jgi:hypothetical protein|nr:hypothetical protein [Chlorobiota bacterium]
MSRQELLQEIALLPIQEQLLLLEAVAQSLQAELKEPPTADTLFDPTAVERLHGVLRELGELRDEDLQKMRDKYLSEKYP